jgi:hypothetical protein
MRIRSPKDFWAGLIFIAIGGGFILLAQQYRLGDLHRMGPAMFPTLVGGLLAGLGAVIALRSFLFDGASVPRFYARPIGVSLVAIVLFGIALQRRGRRARAGRRLCVARRAPMGEPRARRGHDRVLGRGLRLAARPAASALAGFLRPEWRR